MNKFIIFCVGTMVVVLVGIFVYYKYFLADVGLISPSTNIVGSDSAASVSGMVIDKNEFATVAIYNGTAKIGITGKYAEKIVEKFGANVVVKENATKRDYPRSFVVDIDGEGAAMARKLASDLDCPLVTIMPDGESTPSADILVILGGDYR